MRCLALVLSALIIACTTTPAPHRTKTAAAAPAGESCEAAAAQFALGQHYSDGLAEQARTAAGARTVRRLRAGQPITMEYVESRLNLETDAAGQVVKVRCG